MYIVYYTYFTIYMQLYWLYTVGDHSSCIPRFYIAMQAIADTYNEYKSSNNRHYVLYDVDMICL